MYKRLLTDLNGRCTCSLRLFDVLRVVWVELDVPNLGQEVTWFVCTSGDECKKYFEGINERLKFGNKKPAKMIRELIF